VWRGGRRRGGGSTMYTHVSKCKNNKIKGERKNKIIYYFFKKKKKS
jgi:hypothetical protein